MITITQMNNKFFVVLKIMAAKMMHLWFVLSVFSPLSVTGECPPSSGMTTTNDTHTQLILYSLHRYILDVRRTVYI